MDDEPPSESPGRAPGDGADRRSEHRLVELEMKLAFLERTNDDLSDVVLEQGRALEQLQARIRRLEAGRAEEKAPDDPGEAPFA